jgi:hypothetical protein
MRWPKTGILLYCMGFCTSTVTWQIAEIQVKNQTPIVSVCFQNNTALLYRTPQQWHVAGWTT